MTSGLERALRSVFRPGVGRQVVVMLAVFGLLPALVLLGVVSWVQYGQQKETAQELNRAIAQRIASNLSSGLDAVVGRVQSVGQTLRMEGISELDAKLVAYSILGMRPEIDEVVIVDASGREVARLSEHKAYPRSSLRMFPDSRAFAEALKGKTTIGKVVVSPGASVPHVDITVPIQQVLGAPVGAVQVSVNLVRMWSMVSDRALLGNRRAFVVNRSGRVIASGEVSEALQSVDLSDNPLVARYLRGQTGPYEYAAGTEMAVFGASALVPVGGWCVVVEQDPTEAHAGVWAMATSYLGVALGTCAMALVFGVYFSRRFIVVPLERLKGHAERLTRGEGVASLEVEGEGEIAELARTFNRMQATLNLSTVSREFMNSVLSSMSSALFVTDESGSIIISNKAAERLTGMNEEQLLGEDVSRFFPADARVTPFEGESRRALFRGENIHIRDAMLLASNGRRIPVQFSASPIMGLTGVVSRVVCTVEDTTELRNQTQALRESTGKLRAMAEEQQFLLENLRDVVFRLDRDGAVKYVSPSVRKLTGREPLEYLGHFRKALADSPENGPAIRSIARALETGKTQPPCVALVEHAQGRLLTVEISARPYFADGEVGGLVGVARDITDRVAAERALQRSEEFFRTLFDSAPEGLIILTVGGRVHDANPAACALFGQSREDLLNRTAEELWFVEDLPDVSEDLRDVSEDLPDVSEARPASLDGELVRLDGRRADGTAFQSEIRSRRIRAGEERYRLLIVRDISEVVLREQELHKAIASSRAASTAKSSFLANMSHEIRTPLNAILGLSELVLDGRLSREQRANLEMVQESGQSLLRLLNEILDLSRIEAGKLDVVHVNYSPHDVLESMVRTFVYAARQKGVELQARCLPGVPKLLCGDPVRVRQVLVNLVGNAIKFTEDGRVVVEADVSDGFLVFQVEDTGAGIPDDKLESVFEVFNQADMSPSRRFQGSGLGLTISRQLAELMGGDIRLTSEVGKGTVVRLRVPLLKALPESEDDAVQVAEPALSEDVRVLVAEDNRVNGILCTRLLSRFGLRSTLVNNGREALEALRRDAYDIVLMDVQMPGMDGLEATRRIRSGTEPGVDPAIPIVAVTAHAMKGDRELILESGMDSYVSKPLDAEVLRRVMAEVLSGKRKEG